MRSDLGLKAIYVSWVTGQADQETSNDNLCFSATTVTIYGFEP
jgi:hypothetical protein